MTILMMIVMMVMIVLGLYAIWRVHLMQRPTRGQRIDRAGRPGEALVILDMQSDFTGKGAGYRRDDVEAVLSLINEHASEAYGHEIPVITVRHSFKGPVVTLLIRLLAGGRGTQRSAGLGLDPDLEVGAAADFLKHKGDAFSVTDFISFLDANKVGRIRLVGLDGNHSIKSTADGALNRGYDVEILSAAVLALSEPLWRQQQRRLERRGARIIV